MASRNFGGIPFQQEIHYLAPITERWRIRPRLHVKHYDYYLMAVAKPRAAPPYPDYTPASPTPTSTDDPMPEDYATPTVPTERAAVPGERQTGDPRLVDDRYAYGDATNIPSGSSAGATSFHYYYGSDAPELSSRDPVPSDVRAPPQTPQRRVVPDAPPQTLRRQAVPDAPPQTLQRQAVPDAPPQTLRRQAVPEPRNLHRHAAPDGPPTIQKWPKVANLDQIATASLADTYRLHKWPRPSKLSRMRCPPQNSTATSRNWVELKNMDSAPDLHEIF